MNNILSLIIILALNIIFLLLFKQLSFKFNLFDYPDKNRKTQVAPVSLLGGFIIFINLNLYFFYDVLFLKSHFFSGLGFNKNIQILVFFITFYFIYLIGYIDDKLNLSPLNKIFLLTLILVPFFLSNKGLMINSLNFLIFDKQIDLFNFSFFFTIFCLIVFINALNMFDGMNLVSFLFYFLIIFFMVNHGYNYYLSINLMIALITFAILNYQNKCFLGDNGIYILAFLSGLIIINTYETKNLYVEDVLIVIFLPMIDFFRLFFTRIYNQGNPFKSDANHFHHLLRNRYSFKNSILIIFLYLFIPFILNKIFVDKHIFILISSILIYSLNVFFLKKTIINK